MANSTNYQPQIIWRGEAIGQFDNPGNDMWYLEGRWISNESAAAEEFKALVKNLNFQDVFRNLETGTEAFLQSEGYEKLVRIIVMGLLDEDILTARMMLTDEPKADMPKAVEHPSLLRQILNNLK